MRWSVIGGALAAPGNDLVELGWNSGVLRTRRWHDVISVLVGNRHSLVALVGLLAGEHFKHHDAQRIDVAAHIGDAPGNQLW